MYVETIHMYVGPSECNLKNLMEFGKRVKCWYHKETADCWVFTIGETDVKQIAIRRNL